MRGSLRRTGVEKKHLIIRKIFGISMHGCTTLTNPYHKVYKNPNIQTGNNKTKCKRKESNVKTRHNYF